MTKQERRFIRRELINDCLLDHMISIKDIKAYVRFYEFRIELDYYLR